MRKDKLKLSIGTMIHSYGADTIKGLITFMNEVGITKDDIIAIFPSNQGSVTLIYSEQDA